MGATAAIAGVQVFGSIMQYQTQKAEGIYQQGMSKINARRAEIAAEETLRKGDKDASDYSKQVKELTGSQKASLAAQGIDLGFGTASDVVAITEEQGIENIKTIKNNAFREAMGYRTRASDELFASDVNKRASDFKAGLTLLSGGLNAVQGARKNTTTGG